MSNILIAASVASAFNLVCTGTVTTDGRKNGKPYTTIYRVDLDANKWCEENCLELLDLVRVEPNKIVFRDSRVDTPRSYTFNAEHVFRTNGNHSKTYITRNIIRLLMVWKGQCEKSDFTGFPKFDTKF